MQNFSNYNDSSNESCQDSSFREVHTSENCYLALATLIVSPFSLFLYLVLLSIFNWPKRDLYEHFFWQLIV